MNCYAVIDTNVFVSALLSSNENAATVQVIEKFITGEIRAIYSYSTPAYRDPEWIAELFVSDIYRTESSRYGIFFTLLIMRLLLYISWSRILCGH